MIGMSYVHKIEFAINKECTLHSTTARRALTTSYIEIYKKTDKMKRKEEEEEQQNSSSATAAAK